MLPLRLKKDPVFDIDKDIDKIEKAVSNSGVQVPDNVTPFPTARAYILDEHFEPVAIFDRIDYPGFGGLLKLALTMKPNHIDNPAGHVDLWLMNEIRQMIDQDWTGPYTVAVMVGADVYFHFPAATDLVVVLCERMASYDIVDRRLFECVFDAGHIAGRKDFGVDGDP
jgi:hypothetical protein